MHNLASRPGFEVVKIDQNGVEFPLPIHWCHGVPGHHCVNSLCINIPKLHYSICHVEPFRFNKRLILKYIQNAPLSYSRFHIFLWFSTNCSCFHWWNWPKTSLRVNVFPLMTTQSRTHCPVHLLWLCAHWTLESHHLCESSSSDCLGSTIFAPVKADMSANIAVRTQAASVTLHSHLWDIQR